jgi:indole-3-glycerol phosphate synthase
VSILSRVVAEKRELVLGMPALTELEQRAMDADPARPFSEALRAKNPVALIAEIKKASPSRGVLIDKYEPDRIAAAYERGGAACLSVLTDENYFCGTANDLILARREVTLPVLRKDFIVDEKQVYESRGIGADCVLLIAAALEGAQLRDYREVAEGLGMAALVEVHDEGEMDAAAYSEAKLIGINNRDLSTFETDLATTERLARYAPPEAVLVSESGIWTKADVDRVFAAGARAILVGESLMRADNPVTAIGELLG